MLITNANHVDSVKSRTITTVDVQVFQGASLTKLEELQLIATVVQLVKMGRYQTKLKLTVETLLFNCKDLPALAPNL